MIRRFGLRGVRRRCRRVVKQIAIPDSRDVWDLCRAVGERRGKPIELVPLPLSASGACGLWLAAAGVDYICYERDTTPVHQAHIVLHELGHILCGHRGSEAVGPALGGIFPDLSPTTLKIMLARQHAGFSTLDEAEAETVAYLVWDAIDARSGRAGRGLGEMGDRLSLALER